MLGMSLDIIGRLFLNSAGGQLKASLTSKSLFSTNASHLGKYLPTSFKVRKIAPREMRDMINFELERQKRIHLRRQATKKPFEVIFEDRHKTRNFNLTFLSNIPLAMFDAEVKDRLIGRGINITKVNVLPNFQAVNVMWITTQPELEEETAQVLQDCAESVRSIMERICELGRVPTVRFVKDMDYLSSVTLEKEFRNIQESQQSYSPVETDLNAELLDLVCQMQKRTNTLNLDRAHLLNQVLLSLQKAKATHRLARKPGLNDPVPLYLGYKEREVNETPVKKYLGTRNKHLLVSEGILKLSTQGSKFVNSDRDK